MLIRSLYALLVAIWSSTWLAIKVGLQDCPPLLGAGMRFALAGLVLLAVRVGRGGTLRTDPSLAIVLALFQFAGTYGLVYWGEQRVSSGLAAVLFGALPLYTALIGAVVLPDAPLTGRLLGGIALAIGGLALAFAESAGHGEGGRALAGAAAVAVAPIGIATGNVTLKLRGGSADAIALNGWAMLAGGATLLVASAMHERWGDLAWTAASIGSVVYLSVIGSALGFVLLTVLLRELSAVAMSCVHLLVPFGALALGAVFNGEAPGLRAVGGAGLVSAGLLVVQAARLAPVEPET